MARERFAPDDPREWLNRACSNLVRAREVMPDVYLEDLCFDAQQAAGRPTLFDVASTALASAWPSGVLRPDGYVRHRPEESLLYRVVEEHWPEFRDSLLRHLRWRVKRAFGLESVDDAKVGAITFSQRFNSALRLAPHFHCLVPDGASAGDLQLLGDAPGQRTHKAFGPAPVQAVTPSVQVVEVGGLNIHAGDAVDGRDRRRLEQLCRYMARPPLCQERLALIERKRKSSIRLV